MAVRDLPINKVPVTGLRLRSALAPCGLSEAETRSPRMLFCCISLRVDRRAGDRLLQEGNGLRYVSLAGGHHLSDLHPLRVIVPVNQKAENHYQHSGEEWLYVLSGQLVLTLAGQQFLLNFGDAAHFDAFLPHDLSAIGDQDAEILLVACTPTRSLLKSYLS